MQQTPELVVALDIASAVQLRVTPCDLARFHPPDIIAQLGIVAVGAVVQCIVRYVPTPLYMDMDMFNAMYRNSSDAHLCVCSTRAWGPS